IPRQSHRNQKRPVVFLFPDNGCHSGRWFQPIWTRSWPLKELPFVIRGVLIFFWRSFKLPVLDQSWRKSTTKSSGMFFFGYYPMRSTSTTYGSTPSSAVNESDNPFCSRC